MPVGLPDGWRETRGAYLLLSEAYRPDAARAATLGWPVVERLGGHPDIVNDPAAVADQLMHLVAASPSRWRRCGTL